MLKNIEIWQSYGQIGVNLMRRAHFRARIRRNSVIFYPISKTKYLNAQETQTKP